MARERERPLATGAGSGVPEPALPFPVPAVARPGPHSAVAQINVGPGSERAVAVEAREAFRRSWYVTVGQTVAPGNARSRARSVEGRTTDTPLRATP